MATSSKYTTADLQSDLSGVKRLEERIIDLCSDGPSGKQLRDLPYRDRLAARELGPGLFLHPYECFADRSRGQARLASLLEERFDVGE